MQKKKHQHFDIENMKNITKEGVNKGLKALIVLPFAMLAWDYYKSRDVRATA